MRQTNESWQSEVTRLKGKLKITEDKVVDGEKKIAYQEDYIHNLKMEIEKKKQSHLHLSQQNIMLESENSHIKREIKEAEDVIR